MSSKSTSKSKVVTYVDQLEEQLRADGYRGTQRAMRLIKSLRSSLEETGSYSFASDEVASVKKGPTKNGSDFRASLDTIS